MPPARTRMVAFFNGTNGGVNYTFFLLYYNPVIGLPLQAYWLIPV
jgi:hypothetical protein